MALAPSSAAGSWYAWRQPAHGFVAAGCAMSPRTIWPKQPRPRLHSCDQSGHDRKTGANLSTTRQLQMSDYTEAWEPGHSLRTPAPRHLRIAARSAAARTMLHMHPISYRSKDPSALTLSPGRVLWQGDVIDVALQPRKLCHAQERVPRRLSLAQSRLDVGLRDLPST